MSGGVSILINKAHIILVAGVMDIISMDDVEVLKKYFSRRLTKEDFRKAVKERWTTERGLEIDDKMRMLIPAQYPKVWGETRVANKVDMGDTCPCI